MALLEAQVRFARIVARHAGLVEAIAGALYLGLGVLVILWIWRGEWFDAYDAALWLVAFGTIEMNVLRRT